MARLSTQRTAAQYHNDDRQKQKPLVNSVHILKAAKAGSPSARAHQIRSKLTKAQEFQTKPAKAS